MGMTDDTPDADGPESAVADPADAAEGSDSAPDTSDPPADDAAAGDDEAESIRRCDFCRLPCPRDPVRLERDGVDYAFCSEACRAAQADSSRVFTQYHGFRRFRPNVTALDAGLPQGVPRNSFVMLTDLAGTRSEAIKAELVWRALQRGESVVYVTFLEPPVSVIQKFLTLEWNVLPYIESGDLYIIDCFTYRLDDRDRMTEGMDDWNHHLAGVADGSTTQVRDPSATRQVKDDLNRALDDLDVTDDAIVVIDSLTELGTLVQRNQAYDFVKDVRAEVCKSRFVPVFAGATRTTEELEFPHDLGYMVDGIVELRLNEEIIEGALVKQIRVRKMNGVLTFPEWTAYEYTSGQGIVMFDPLEEVEKSRERREAVESVEHTEVDAAPQDETTSASEAASTGDGHQAAGGEEAVGDESATPSEGEDTDDPDEETADE
jgi:KaiC/GvpD/RAD55 family RecA-like ATPase